MAESVFISYSRKDQEFVRRMAEDLNRHVDGGVWFDQSDIQPGDRWRDQIINGIREAQVIVLVLSPDAAASQYVQMELKLALEAGKKVIPVLYRPVKLEGDLDEFVRETQFIDLQRGSYTDNFQVLVDALVSSGVARADGERPFLRGQVKTDWGAVFRKIPGWAFAWSFGWAVFWLIVTLFLSILQVIRGQMGSDDIFAFLIIIISGGIGGFLGGLLAGIFTMLALRPNAPSISWKHMSPTIRIWAISGPLGMIVSGVITSVMIAAGALRVQSSEADCSGLSFNECVGQIFGQAIGQAIAFFLIILFVFLLFLIAAWFLTGVFAGWLAVRHIRRLEPGITRGQTRWVMFGWGLGGLAGTILTLVIMTIISSAFGMLGS